MGIKLSEIKDPKLRARIIAADNQPVARRIRSEVSKSDQRREGEDCGVETGEESVRYRVVFTVFRSRLLDEGDNDRTALKAIRDRLASRLELPNDSLKYFDFEYHQIKSDIVQGTHILIRRL